MLASSALTLVTLVLLALLVTSVQAFLRQKDTARDLAMVADVAGGDELLREVQADLELFRRAYLDSFRSDSDVNTMELFDLKRRVVDNLNIAYRRLRNDVDAERKLLQQIEAIEDELGDKLSDVTKRRKEGFWLGPLDSYFYRKAQRGKLDIFGRSPDSTVTRQQHDRLAQPKLRPVNFEVHEGL